MPLAITSGAQGARMNPVIAWFRRHLSNPQIVILGVLLIIGGVLVLALGGILAPVLVSLVLAYLLEGLVKFFERLKIPRILSVAIIFVLFMAGLLFLFVALVPLLWQQSVQLIQGLPSKISWTQDALMQLPDRYPEFFSEQQIRDFMAMLRSELANAGQRLVSLSIASARLIVWIVVYMFLVPMLVFFFLKDKNRLLEWVRRFLPAERRLASEVWQEVDRQIGNYVRGKAWEILIVWVVSFITFSLLGLEFAMLLSLFVGLSVLIPYIGATVMTFPVAFIAYFQWGPTAPFFYTVGAYLLIQILDGNVLVALLFSEAVNLHPIAIIVAVLFFGGVLGFWGIFFAIPLATLVQAIINQWGRTKLSA